MPNWARGLSVAAALLLIAGVAYYAIYGKSGGLCRRCIEGVTLQERGIDHRVGRHWLPYGFHDRDDGGRDNAI